MLKKNIDVLILIEHKARELESAVLLKYFFEIKGYNVIIESIKFHKESVILKYNPKIAILPWAYSNKEMNLFKNFNWSHKKSSTLFFNMHHEQLSNEGSQDFIIPQDEAKKTLHLSWGDDYTNKLLDAQCNSESIIQVGNPRLDFYKGNLKNISLNRDDLASEFNLNKNKKWVLFIANAFHLWTPEQINENISKGVDVKEQIESSVKNRKEFLGYVRKYLDKNDDIVFIYRPHPSFVYLENEELEIKEMLNKYKNFKCISEKSIRDWIVNVDITLSFHSTAVIECAAAGIPFYLMRAHKLSHSKDYTFFKDYQYVIKKYEEFEAVLTSNKNINYDDFKQQLKLFIDLTQIEYSSKLIVDKVDEIYTKSTKIENVEFNRINYLRTIVIAGLKKIIYLASKNKKFKQQLLKTQDIRFYNLLFEGDDYFTQKEIDKLTNKIKGIFENNID